ncbi:F-box/FBD/LRR-repeat protein At1g78750-like [Silene latifolia]|uniref:F-box/FBD/LRR-repeat protein At1g78750-like n=1 Tax=Silene latifolia TaxID=37657 RepID=UPI003D780D31
MEDILNISTLSISEKPDTDTVDRLSSLPEHLISEILSKLPTDSAVATSILSRHWRHQWTYITRIFLSSLNISNCDELHAFLTTVDNILRQLNSPPSNLRTIYLNFKVPYPDDAFEDDIAYELCCEFLPRWFHRLCTSHTQLLKVFEFGAYLYIYIENAPLVFICSPEIESSPVVDTVFLPECIFQNKTLVELVLNTNFSFNLPNYLNLPNLNTLSVHIFEHDRQLMRTIFKSLPLLQNLTISADLSGEDHLIDISAPNLKTFRIVFEGRDSQTNVLIDAPKLKRISISIRGGLVSFRFVKIPTDLLETSLSDWDSVGDDLAILELVKAISNTRSLRLSCRILNVLNSYNVDELPTFHNLVSLTLALSDAEDMNLVIPVWILRRLKKIQVDGVIKGNEYDKEISLMEDILSKANVLERLICVFNPNVEEPEMDSLKKQNDFVNALFMLPRVCSSCEIKFIGNFVRVSTNVAESRSVTLSDLLD